MVMQNVIATVCNLFNKEIDEEGKNNVMRNINQLEFKTIQQNITNIIQQTKAEEKRKQLKRRETNNFDK